MAAGKPILVMQMQRMGDLILSFPLFMWLARTYPDHPVHVVAEISFFRHLIGIGPKVHYIAWEHAPGLRGHDYHLLINLSLRHEAAVLAGEISAGAKFGPVVEPSGARRVLGAWQLYRASVVRNNRHNLFHWADLNALDVIPLREMAETVWPEPRERGLTSRNIGLFVGASQECKRPDLEFYRDLARELSLRDLRPVLLGGPADVPFAGAVEAAVKAQGGAVINLCGRLSLTELAVSGQGLRLLVTPDTGPMHLAAWTGLRALNISMGPVNAWETGPYQPGHLTARADMSCLGCWECIRMSARGGYPCRDNFKGHRVAGLIRRLLQRGDAGLAATRPSGLLLDRTGRNPDGLYELHPLGMRPVRASELLSRFWRTFWSLRFGIAGTEGPLQVQRAWGVLAGAAPRLDEAMSAALADLGRELRLVLRPGGGKVLDDDFWRRQPPGLRSLTGYLHLLLQNGDFSRRVWLEALELVEGLAGLRT